MFLSLSLGKIVKNCPQINKRADTDGFSFCQPDKKISKHSTVLCRLVVTRQVTYCHDNAAPETSTFWPFRDSFSPH